MATPAGNILRWSFLGFGVLYGFRHQRSLYKEEKEHNAKVEYERKQKLIDLAKAEYQRSLLPPDQRDGGIISNPDDPKFDLEKYLNHVAAGDAKSKA
ncbi:hypothetical protein H072_5218 [Dactylellina haptotyla CBS 200.50]|uniref:ATP synthase F(0) complex subunit e, mitochondrial n=1 Tax=Dactylellina haptotyla (strain CBS 200.50) TaxID=1284197 RepID=S8AD55_DACHA|nr:hypothetical protein H072_5218 [Dactylellina haptotyla CBS 200.50]